MAEIRTFAYQAQSAEGQVFNGRLEAPGIYEASRQLQSLNLQVTRIEPVEETAKSTAPFKAADFLAFNQQLAQLTASGLPIERSLRLMAAELNDKRHSAALNRIATELEKGAPLAAAFAAQQASFPPLYARLLEAGVRSNNLPAMLLNLGRHVQLLQRLRSAWWRSASYPLMVLFCLLLVMAFIWTFVMPRFLPLAYGPIFQTSAYGRPYPSGQMGIDPAVLWFLSLANVVGYCVMSGIALLLLSVLILCALNQTAEGRRIVETIIAPLPLVGAILKWNLIARWCDALHLGVQGGLPLPAALELARDALDSQRLRADSQTLIDTVSAGRSLELDSTTHFLPPLIPATLQMGIERNDLPAAAAMLTQMYQEQAEIRLAVLPRVLAPLLLILTAMCIGLAVAAILLPLVMMIRAITGP